MARAVGDDPSRPYRDKGDDYFSQARRDYVAALPDDPDAAILELGCGAGATGALALARGKCRTYVGIEMFEPMAARAAAALTAVHVGDIESMDLPYPPETFDALICSEVLEHLTDPEPVLRRLVSLLKPGGRVYASSPNVAHWRIVLDLLRGRFDYQARGPMDRTHLRWFTPRTFRRMFEDAGIAVDYLARVGARFPIPALPPAHMTWLQIDLRGRRVR